MKEISDVPKAIEATVRTEDRGRRHWFLDLRIRRDGKVTVDQKRYIERMLAQFQLYQCQPQELQFTWILNFRHYQTETKKGIKGPTEAWLDFFCIWHNTQGRTSCLRSTFRLDTWMQPINTGYAEHDSTEIFNVQRLLNLLTQKALDWSGDVNGIKSTTGFYFEFKGRGAALSWVWQNAGHICTFFIESKISGLGSSS